MLDYLARSNGMKVSLNDRTIFRKIWLFKKFNSLPVEKFTQDGKSVLNRTPNLKVLDEWKKDISQLTYTDVSSGVQNKADLSVLQVLPWQSL